MYIIAAVIFVYSWALSPPSLYSSVSALAMQSSAFPLFWDEAQHHPFLGQEQKRMLPVG